MGQVRRLPAAVANQIAAGEVVERPAAVVRELVENSIDAGARRVSVVSRKAGRGEIRVTDDGIGMTPEDARLALERHATSKIESVEDLGEIGSLGFRGEALPAIASVSRFRLGTRPEEAESGWEIRVEGGRTTADRPAGLPPGTVVEVRDLFFNTPARRKFLRADATEAARIVASVQLLAASWPEVRFDLESGGRSQISVPPAPDRAGRLRQLEPRFFKTALAADSAFGACSVRAFLSPPMAPRGASTGVRLFVNGRAISDRRLFHAVTQAYREISSLAGAPKAYVFLEVPPEEVDVNVHPAKAEVRFSDGGGMWRIVHLAVLDALRESPRQVAPGGGAALGAGEGAGWAAAPGGGAGMVREGGGVFPGGGAFSGDGREAADLLYGGPAVGEGVGGPSPVEEARYLDFAERPPRVLAQFRSSYILAEDGDGLLLVDQHAAEERALFEKLMERSARPETARFLQPVPLELSAAERAELEAERERLVGCGFEIGEGNGGAPALLGAPAALGLGAGVSVLLRSLSPAEGECAETASLDLRARIFARVACHASVTAKTRLSPERMEAILENLWAAPNPATCPHGRPTALRFDLDWLERRFGRR